MFRTAIRADENTDVAAVVSNLRRDCEAAGLSPVLSQVLAEQADAVLVQLVQTGRQLGSQGSQMQATREIAGDGYSVQIIFGVGPKPSFLQRMMQRFAGA